MALKSGAMWRLNYIVQIFHHTFKTYPVYGIARLKIDFLDVQRGFSLFGLEVVVEQYPLKL